jgi:arsenite transporter
MSTMAAERPLVIFLCTANACRSQMAEHLCRALWGRELDVRSAGVRPGKPDPRALAVLGELGIATDGA